MMIKSLILVLIFSLVFTIFCYSGVPAKAAQSSVNELRGTFDYIATYESGSRAGTQTKGHRVMVETLPDGQYQLAWGELKVTGMRVGNGLIYRWQSSDGSGEGVYIIYDHGDKLFGTFSLKDENGEQRGYTQGTKIEN